MSNQPRSGTPDLFERQLNAEVAALVAVVEQGDRPGDRRALRVVGGVIVLAVVGELLRGRPA
ncbi:MAG: hypothetical protein M3179_08085 [Actinomycetota bacterium]|nr:hypothetical protein [Actinomycetota bacterium]